MTRVHSLPRSPWKKCSRITNDTREDTRTEQRLMDPYTRQRKAEEQESVGMAMKESDRKLRVWRGNVDVNETEQNYRG